MKKIRIISMIAAILVFVLAFLLVTSGFLTGGNKKDDENKVDTVVAIQDIPQFTKITEDMVAVVKREPAEGINTFSKAEDVVGKVIVTDIYQGEAIVDSRVKDETDTSIGMTSQIQPGMRAVTLELPLEMSLANNLKVGYYVDVVQTAEITVEGIDAGENTSAGEIFDGLLGEGMPNNSAIMNNKISSKYSAVFLQNIKIIGLDKIIKFQGEETNQDGEPIATEYASVTVEASPEDALKLIYLQDSGDGTVRLILRGFEDNEEVSFPRTELLSAE